MGIESMLAGAGAGIGAGLGQVGDVLNAPRRASWNLAAQLGQMAGIGDGTAYDSGADMLSGALGMDPNSMLTQGLGMGAEMLLDPLTYAGGAIGRLGGAGVNAMRGVSAADKVGDAATVASRLERMAGPASVPGQAMREGAMAQQAAAQGDVIGNLLNKPMPIEPYMESALSGADDAGRLSRRLEQAATMPGGVAPPPEMPSALTPRGGANALNPRKAMANERYLGDKMARIGDVDTAALDAMGPGAVSPGSFAGPYTPQVPGVRGGPDPFDIYGPALAAGLVGGGAGAAYMFGQNR